MPDLPPIEIGDTIWFPHNMEKVEKRADGALDVWTIGSIEGPFTVRGAEAKLLRVALSGLALHAG